MRKPEVDRLKPYPSLSKSASGVALKENLVVVKEQLPSNGLKGNLSSSCFGAIRTQKSGDDDDLTSLNWLQKSDVLKGLHVSTSSLPMSPPLDGSEDMGDASMKDGAAGTSASSGSPDLMANKKKSPSKPPYSFSSLIFMAIEESPHKRLPVKDIYNWIVDHFPFYRDAKLGWKNSVRHNLSLNKCFKKVEKEKGQNVGKGSLWCVDADFRPNLLQALRKTPSFHAHHHLLTTPPPSPQHSGSLGSVSRHSHSGVLSPSGQRSGVQSPDVDPDAEAEAVAQLMLISTPRSAPLGDRCHSCPPSSDGEDVEPELVRRTAKEYYYKHRGSFSGPVSMIKDKESRFMDRIRNSAKHRLSSSLNLPHSDHQYVKRYSISPDSSMDGEYEFDHNSDSEDEDSEVDEVMQDVIRRDELSDSGYGQGVDDEKDEKENVHRSLKFQRARAGRKNNMEEKLNEIVGADALLTLASSACPPVPSPEVPNMVRPHLAMVSS